MLISKVVECFIELSQQFKVSRESKLAHKLKRYLVHSSELNIFSMAFLRILVQISTIGQPVLNEFLFCIE